MGRITNTVTVNTVTSMISTSQGKTEISLHLGVSEAL